MSIYLSHMSALDYLRSSGAAALSRITIMQGENCKLVTPTKFVTTGMRATAYSELAQLEDREFEYLSNPVHLLAPNAEMRLRRKGIICHVSPQSLSSNSFIQVDHNVFACSAEPCFIQMATILSFPRLLMLGCEFSGTYRLSAGDPRGFLDAGPIFTTCSLNRFLCKAEGMRGVKNTQRVLPYIVEGSASPMETIVVLLLCLPRHLGGYGLPIPNMNGRVDVGKRARKAATKTYYKCDLLWEEANLAVEYESDLCHTGSDNLANDSARRSALAYLGVEVVTLTRRQVFHPHELDRVALLLSKRLLRRQPVVSNTWVAKRNELHRQLVCFSQ